MIRDIKASDVKQIAGIYNYYVSHSHHTFETETISEKEMSSRISSIRKEYPFIVFEEDENILAYAYATRWKVRQAYDHTVESSIYVNPNYQGKGVGTSLYTQLINDLKEKDLHSILAGISLPNEASIHLHEKLGFTQSGVLKEVGLKFGKWIDVGYWNLLV